MKQFIALKAMNPKWSLKKIRRIRRSACLVAAGIFLCTAIRYCAAQTSAQQAPIRRTTHPDGWLIRTRSSAYQLIITSAGQVCPVYYGALAAADHPDPEALWAPRVPEVPARKGSAAETTVLEVVFHDRDREAELVYVSGTPTEVDGRPTPKIVEKDRTHPLEVISYIRVLGEYGVLEKWIELKNMDSKFPVKIENLLSASILLPSDSYVLTQLSGHEPGEFHPYRSLITPGVKLIGNRQFKSNDNMPWFLVTPEGSLDPTHGPAWWGSVHYSGNWKLAFDNAYDRKYGFTLQIAGGINFWDTEWTLKPGATVTTPKFSTGYTQEGSEGAARSNAAYVRNTILPAAHRHQLRPILFNGWIDTTYHVNDSVELAMARVAADVGVELFAIDDGWFKGRRNGATGLGDWEVAKKKFPRGWVR